MLSLKNLFPKPTTNHEPPVPSAPNTMDALAKVKEAEGLAKHKEMFPGKAQVQVKRCRAHVEDDGNSLEHAKHALMGDEVDLSVATKAVKHAEDRLHESDMLLTAALAKEESAQRELTNAKDLVSIEREAAACARVLALGPRGEEIFAAARRLSMDVVRETEALRVAGGDERYAHSVSKIREQFEFFLRLAGHTHNVRMPSRLMAFETWSDCLAAKCGMKKTP